MHNQSDYSYDVPQMEFRDKWVCLCRAKFCLKCANKHGHMRDIFLQFAKEWVEMFELYPL